ncbi:plasmid replication initiator RepA [Buchnera aphidicola]|uniref:plasmid replication initiator RepA n=1 Tax=Buchnera aphidicola TaxID=9 RepID=UPI0034639578
MSRKNYIHNSKPVFKKPKNEKKRSKFVCYAIKRAKQIDVARSPLYHTLISAHRNTSNVLFRVRRLNENRARAMRAMVIAMLYYYDIRSNTVNASIEKLSDECGLSTISDAGNKSITRASRLIKQFMEPMGFIQYKKIKNSFLSTSTHKKIFLTPVFFMLFKISQSTINYYLCDTIRLFKYSHMKEKKIFVSFEEIKKISQMDEKSIRKKILNILINYYTVNELAQIGPKRLKKKIDIEYNNLCKLYKNDNK